MNRILAALLILAAGCGPVTYMSQVGVRANKYYAGAKDVHADRYAPYEFYAGYYYLLRARVKGGYGDYEFARKYGIKSEKMFKRAKRLAVDRVARGETGSEPKHKQGKEQPKRVVIAPQEDGE